MAKTRKRNPQKSSKGRKRKQQADGEGEHVRHLAPATAVRAVINEITRAKTATSEVGQEVSTATKRFADQGGNVPAVRLAQRVYGKAKHDPMKARVMWEDAKYYLEECTDFNRIAPAGMFTAEESGQKRSRKPKQEELPVDHVEHQADSTFDEQPTIQ